MTDNKVRFKKIVMFFSNALTAKSRSSASRKRSSNIPRSRKTERLTIEFAAIRNGVLYGASFQNTLAPFCIQITRIGQKIVVGGRLYGVNRPAHNNMARFSQRIKTLQLFIVEKNIVIKKPPSANALPTLLNSGAPARPLLARLIMFIGNDHDMARSNA